MLIYRCHFYHSLVTINSHADNKSWFYDLLSKFRTQSGLLPKSIQIVHLSNKFQKICSYFNELLWWQNNNKINSISLTKLIFKIQTLKVSEMYTSFELQMIWKCKSIRDKGLNLMKKSSWSKDCVFSVFVWTNLQLQPFFSPAIMIERTHSIRPCMAAFIRAVKPWQFLLSMSNPE